MTTPVTPVTVSPEAQAMVDAGVTPYIPDVAAMLATINALQARVAAVEADKGIPSDPVGAAIKDLTAHVKARAAQYPNHDFSSVLDALDNLPETPDLKSTELVKALVDDLAYDLKQLEIDYLPKLARSLHLAVAKQG